MSEKRFALSNPISHNSILSWVSIIHDDIGHKHLNAEEICELLNEQQSTITALKEENEQLQKKTEMDKNDFFISEAKRMRLLAFIEDNGLRKEYSEWERRIWDE